MIVVIEGAYAVLENQVLSIDATYVTPSREKLTASISVLVRLFCRAPFAALTERR